MCLTSWEVAELSGAMRNSFGRLEPDKSWGGKGGCVCVFRIFFVDFLWNLLGSMDGILIGLWRFWDFPTQKRGENSDMINLLAFFPTIWQLRIRFTSMQLVINVYGAIHHYRQPWNAPCNIQLVARHIGHPLALYYLHLAWH